MDRTQLIIDTWEALDTGIEDISTERLISMVMDTTGADYDEVIGAMSTTASEE